jgi:hypothetical protein
VNDPIYLPHKKKGGKKGAKMGAKRTSKKGYYE